jgi:hypothetical protein
MRNGGADDTTRRFQTEILPTLFRLVHDNRVIPGLLKIHWQFIAVAYKYDAGSICKGGCTVTGGQDRYN